MNRKQMLKNRRAMDYFMDGGSIVAASTTGNWEVATSPTWATDYTFIQNDRYVELRKGLAGHKVIQIKVKGEWQDLEAKNSDDPQRDFASELRNYRIKPTISVGETVYSHDGRKFKIKSIAYGNVVVEEEITYALHELEGLL